MRTLAVLLGTLCLLAGLTGCGGDPQAEYIGAIISTADDVTANMATVKTTVEKAVKTRKENKEGKTELTKGDLKEALVLAEELPKLGERLQKRKGTLDSLKESTTEEHKKQLEKQFGGRLRDAIVSLDKAYRDLELVVTQADDIADAEGREELKKLRSKIKEGMDPFDLLTKQH